MVGTLDLTDYYSASNFEEDVISLLETLHRTTPTVVMTGGSMMYIDAVCKVLTIFQPSPPIYVRLFTPSSSVKDWKISYKS